VGQVTAAVLPHDRAMALDAHAFLSRTLAINHGVLPPSPTPLPVAHASAAVEERVLVIGAGMAGLAALRALTQAGVPALALEARDRLGGRVHTVPLTTATYAGRPHGWASKAGRNEGAGPLIPLVWEMAQRRSKRAGRGRALHARCAPILVQGGYGHAQD
jgi:hypothetical protein